MKYRSRKHLAARWAQVAFGLVALAEIAMEVSQIVVQAKAVLEPFMQLSDALGGKRVLLVVTIGALIYASANKLWQEQDINEGRHIERDPVAPQTDNSGVLARSLPEVQP